mgnify:CR=1 FL=1
MKKAPSLFVKQESWAQIIGKIAIVLVVAALLIMLNAWILQMVWVYAAAPFITDPPEIGFMPFVWVVIGLGVLKSILFPNRTK